MTPAGVGMRVSTASMGQEGHLEVEAEEAIRVPGLVTLGVALYTHHGHCSVVCVSQHKHR